MRKRWRSCLEPSAGTWGGEGGHGVKRCLLHSFPTDSRHNRRPWHHLIGSSPTPEAGTFLCMLQVRRLDRRHLG